MKRKPARLSKQSPSQPNTRPACPLAHRTGDSTIIRLPDGTFADPRSLIADPPSLAAIHAALDEIAKEWGIRL